MADVRLVKDRWVFRWKYREQDRRREREMDEDTIARRE